MSNPFDAFDSPAPAPRAPRTRSRIDPDAISRGAAELGIDPVDLATAISYETGGTFDPDKKGPTTKWGQHQGLIQFGEPQRAKYGVRPGMTMAEQMPAVVAFLRDAGVRPGMGMLDVYSAINAGGVGRYNASDAAAGGMPGTVADKVNFQMADHRAKASRIMGGGSGGGGGTGGYPAPAVAAGNPFDQFDSAPAPSAAAALGGANPFDAFDAPDFSNLQTASGSTEAAAGLPVLPSSAVMSGNGDIPLRAEDREVGAIYTDKRGEPRRWTGDGWLAGDSARETTVLEALGGTGIDVVQGLTRAPESLLDLIGWATGGESLLTPEGKAAFEDSRQTLEQFKPEAYRAEQAVPVVQRDEQGGIAGVNLPSGESVMGTIGQSAGLLPQMVYGGGGAKALAEKVLPNAPRLASVLGYGTANAGMVAPGIAEQARTEALAAGATPEQAQDVANKAMAMAVPLTMATGGVGEGLAGAQGAGAKSLVSALFRGAATEAPAEAVEEAGTSAIGDIAQGRQVNTADALESGIMAAFGGGIPGAAVAGTEYAGNRNRPAAMPADGINIAELVAAMQPTPPAVAAEVTASPRQGDAPAAPPTPAVADAKPEVSPPAEAPAAEPAPAVRPDMAAATRSIDDRLAALDDTAAGQIDEAEVSALNTERQELDDLLREQDRAKREGLIQSPESRLSPQERATADARRTEIAATLERHRAARTAADQAQRLRTRLENTDSDAGLFEVAREINPTLGTPQAEQFRTSPASAEAPGTVSGAPAAATPSVPTQAAAAPSRTEPPVSGPVLSDVPDRGQNAPYVAPARATTEAAPSDRTEPQNSQRVLSNPASSMESGASETPRADAQREPRQTAIEASESAIADSPPKLTSLKNAVTDAERVAEGRDPIIRKALKADKEMVSDALAAIRETPSIGRETALRLSDGGPVEPKDEAVLMVYKVDLQKRRDAAAERAQSPSVSEEGREIARREHDELELQIDEVDQAAVRVGTDWSQLGRLRKRMISENFSLPALERKLKMIVNRELKPAEKTELKAQAEQIAALQRKLDSVQSEQARAQVAEMLARLIKQAPGKNATLAQRRAAAMESKAALSAMSSARGSQKSIAAAAGAPGQSRAALAERLGRGVVARLERAGVLEFDDRSGGTWDGTRIGIGNVSPENALGVLLHEVTHANMLDVLGEQGYERALRDLDALEAAGDPLALKAKRRAAKSGETGQRLDDERIAYMVEEATNAAAPAPKVTEFVRSLFSAFRRWAATSAVFRALEKIGVDRPTLKPADFAAFARKGLDRMVADAKNPESAGLRGKVRELETQLRTNRLTGLPNRLAFDEDAALGWPTVAFFDVDSFKKLNDQVGHDPADVVLKLIGEEVKKLGSAGIRPYHVSGDEFLFRFKSEADAKPLLDKLQDYLEGVTVELETRDADNNPRFFEYQGIGISYGVGANYDQADSATKLQKQSRLESGAREEPRGDGPSRRIRESTARPGGRREGDPPAVGAQRSIPEGENAAPAGADPVAFFHLARMGAFHYADGARTEAEWTKRMEDYIGPAADRYRSMLPDAFKASKAQADRVAKGPETVAEAVEAIGEQRRPRDVKRVVRAVVAEGIRGEEAIISATAQALDMDDADVRTLFVQSESQARTLTEAQAELKDLRKQLRDAQKPDPETRYQDTRARDFQRRIADLEARIAAGDFAKTEKTVHALDEKNTRLEFQLQKVKSEFAFYALEKEFAERAPLAKFTGYIGETFSLLRAIKTSLDLSATLMQGGMMVVNRPYLLKHLKPTVNAAWSEELEFEAIKTMQSSPNYPRFKKLGLYLPGTDAQLEKAEEAFAGRWIRKIPTKYGGGLLRASSRSYTTFLNLIRIETFDKMEQSMSLDGQFDEADSKALAKSINIMTGRGSLGRFEDAAGFFNIILFAARFTASRFQVLAGLPLTNTVFGGGPRARRAIRKEYARYMLGVAAFYAFYALVRDPEDNKRFVEHDPRSVNFGAVKFGDEIYVNPLSGLSQATVFLTRLATGEEKKTMTGKIVPLRDNYRLTDYAPGLGQGWELGKVKGGKTTLGESGRFLRTKLSPAVGAGVNVMLGKNMIGDEYTWADVPADLTVPMSLGDLVDTVENQGVPRGMAINLAAFLGHGRQYRKSDAEKAAEDANGIPGALGFGTAEETE